MYDELKYVEYYNKGKSNFLHQERTPKEGKKSWDLAPKPFAVFLQSISVSGYPTDRTGRIF